MKLKHINVWQASKVIGLLGAILGFIEGVILSFGVFALGASASLLFGPLPAVVGMGGAIAIIIATVVAGGIMGLICGAITSAAYNWVAETTGGLELEFSKK